MTINAEGHHARTRRQFIAMVSDPDYQAIAPIRAAALADARLVETTALLPMGGYEA